MSPLEEVIINKKSNINPVWIMRQAGRYLPEFREIRKKNPDFIKLCLNEKLSSEITLQPLKRFNLDAAIIFSDILMLPYGLGQDVTFKKDFGPILGDILDIEFKDINEQSFLKKLMPVYKSMNNLSKILRRENKSLIGFVGAPWTLLVYMLNKQSPKKELSQVLNDNNLKRRLVRIITDYLKIHIREQVKAGATTIQIFDSWAGLAKKVDLQESIYRCTAELTQFTKSLNIPVICFPREIEDYKIYVDEVKPSAINIDYNIKPDLIINDIKIPVQGGLDPKILLTDKQRIKEEATRYMEIFKNHPYIFNLGHGVLPETDPEMVKYLVKIVKEFK